MAQTDYDIVDQTGLSFLADLNTTLAAIVSNNSGATEPADTFAYMWWADTTSGLLKQRNAADTGWVDVLTLAGIKGSDIANTPAGNIVSTNQQAAVNELDTDISTNTSDILDRAELVGATFTGDIAAPGLDIEKSNPTGGGFLSITNTDQGFTGKIADIIFKISDSVGDKKDVAYIQAIPKSVNVNTGASLSFFTRKVNDTPTESMRIDRDGNVYPGIDNNQTLGSASLRWSEVFAGTGTINTSDAREKTPVRGMTDSEVSAAKDMGKEIGIYQFLASIKEKGDDARQHVGLTVQRAIEIMEANGLEPFSYGFICFDEWDDIFVEHAEIVAVESVEAEAATYESVVEVGHVVIDGETVETQRTVLKEITPAVAQVEAVEAKAAWTEQTREAGDRYAFRYDQLNLFIARGIEARLSALEANV